MSRQELIENAIKFLKDPKVQEAPLAKRISFLETKGLTQEEIKIALDSSLDSSLPPPLPPPSYKNRPPLRTQTPWGWKDYTLFTIGIAGTGYGMYHLLHVCLDGI